MVRRSGPPIAVAVGLVVVFVLGSTRARADVEHDSGFWGAAIGQGSGRSLSPSLERWRWWLEAQVRLRDDATAFDQAFPRVGLGYALTPRAVLWAGYGWFVTTPEYDPTFDEHRLWQQLTWSTELDRFLLHTRTRLEQRFLETGDDVGWRFRQWGKLSLPVRGELHLVVWDELFFALNDTDWGASGGFDQNRFFAGVGWSLGGRGRWRLEVGYLNQFIARSGRDDDMNHLLSVTLLYNGD